MTVAENIEAVLDRLYVAKREMQSAAEFTPELANPVFVLVTKNKESRHKAENAILHYLKDKFGFDITKTMPYDIHPFENTSTFRFPNGIVVTLMEFEE